MTSVLPFLDTNVIIRYLTQDNPEHSRQAYNFLKGVEEGTEKVETSEAVIVEAVQVLSSKVLYHLPRQQVRNHLHNILFFRGLRIPKKTMIARALNLYVDSNLDFVDCLIVCHVQSKQLPTIISFDRDFDGISGVNRKEP